MADRVHQRASETVGTAQGLGLDRLAGQVGALDRHRALIQQGQGQLLFVRTRRQGGGLDPSHARPVAHALQKPEGPARLRQGAGAVAGGFAFFPGPARGGHGFGVQFGLAGRSGSQDQFAVNGQQDDRPGPCGGGRLFGQDARSLVPITDPGQTLTGGQKGGHRRGAALSRPSLLSHPPRQRASRQGHAPEDDQGQHVRRRPDGETELRLQEQEVVGQEGDGRRRQSGPQSIESARRQNRRQIDDAQVHTLEGPVQQEGQSRRRNDAGDADGVAAPPSGQVQAYVFRRFRFRLDLVGDDVNGHAPRLTQQFGGQRPAQPLRQAAVASLGQDDLGDMVVVSVVHDGAHHIVAAENYGAPAQLLGQFQRIGQLARRADAVARARRPIDMSHGPGRVHHHVGQAPPRPNQGAGHGVARHQDQDALARRPRPGRALFAQTGGQLIVHRLGRAAQRQFAQGRQVLDLEEVVRGQPGRLRHIDLALGQTLAQLLRGDVHHLDVVGA